MVRSSYCSCRNIGLDHSIFFNSCPQSRLLSSVGTGIQVVHINTHICIYTHMYAHTYVYTHICMHTHTQIFKIECNSSFSGKICEDEEINLSDEPSETKCWFVKMSNRRNGESGASHCILGSTNSF